METAVRQMFAALTQRYSRLLALLSMPPVVSPVASSDQHEPTLAKFTKVKSTLLQLRRDLSEERKQRSTSERKWEQSAEDWKAQSRDLEAGLKTELERQRETWEGKLEAQVKFVEELLADKEGKIREIQEWRKRYADLEAKHQQALSTAHEKASKALKKAKDQWTAEANVRYSPPRRALLAKDMERQAKEMTARGLEPQLMKLITDQQAAIEEVKLACQRQLAEALQMQESRNQAGIVLLT